MTYSVTAIWTAKPGLEAEVEQVLTELTAASRDEPGNVFYLVSRVVDQPGTFLLSELYADEAAYAAHQATPHFQRLAVEHAIPNLLASRERTFSVPLDEPRMS